MEPTSSAPPRISDGDAITLIEAVIANPRIVRYVQYRDGSTGRYVSRSVVETLPPQRVLVEARTIYLPATETVALEAAAA